MTSPSAPLSGGTDGGRRVAAGLAVAMLAVGLVVARPLPGLLTEALPFGPYPTPGSGVVDRAAGDALQLYYHLWLARESLLGRARPFDDPYQFAAQGPRATLGASFPPLALPFALLSPLGTLAAYNLLVLLSFPACALAAYALARRLGAPALGAAAVGIAYALARIRLDPLFEGQPAGYAPAFVPLVVLGLDRALVEGRRRGALAGGLAYVGVAMLEPHHAYFLGGLVVAYALVRGAGLDARQRRRAGGSLAVFGALVAAGVGWQWLVRETLLVGSVVAGGRSLAEIRVSSPGLSALGDWDTYGGRAVALLAVPGLLLARGVLPAFWGAVAALGLVLGLGPTVPGLPLYETLHRVLPGFAFIRNVPRFHFLALLGLTALAALGARALGARVPPRRRVAAGLALLGLVLADTVPRHGIAVMRLADHPVYTRLRAEARRVLYLPLFAGDSVAASAALYHPTRTRVPMLNGYSPLAPRAYDAEIVRPLRALNVGDVGEAERAWLRRLGVSHVVLDRAAPGVGPFPFAFVRARLAGAGGLALVEGTDPLWLFRVTDHYTVPVVLPTSPVGLLLEAEQLARDTGAVTREADASAGALVVARAERDAPGRLIAGALAFLPRGVYRVTLHARGEAGALEIWSEDGTRRLAATPWPAGSGWCDVTVTLPLTHAQAVRVAVPWAGRADAAVDAVHVVFADRPEPEWTFEAAALPHWGGERADPPATAGRAVLVASSTPPGLVVVQGPTRTFPSGRHRLLLRARLAAPGTGALLSVAVEGPAGLVRASRVVEAAELAEDAYREVALDFALDRVTVLDFPVSYLGAAGVYLDRLRVIPNPG